MYIHKSHLNHKETFFSKKKRKLIKEKVDFKSKIEKLYIYF